jgi:hypothetical protein
MICLDTKFHTSVSSGSLVIAIKPKAKEVFCTPAVFQFYIPQKYLYFSATIITIRNFRTLYYVALLLHLTYSRVRHVVITDCRKLKRRWSGIQWHNQI